MPNNQLSEELIWNVLEFKRKLAESNIDTSNIVYMQKIPYDYEYEKRVIFGEIAGIKVGFLIFSPNE